MCIDKRDAVQFTHFIWMTLSEDAEGMLFWELHSILLCLSYNVWQSGTLDRFQWNRTIEYIYICLHNFSWCKVVNIEMFYFRLIKTSPKQCMLILNIQPIYWQFQYFHRNSHYNNNLKSVVRLSVIRYASFKFISIYNEICSISFWERISSAIYFTKFVSENFNLHSEDTVINSVWYWKRFPKITFSARNDLFHVNKA